MFSHSIPISFVYGLLLVRSECSAFISTTTVAIPVAGATTAAATAKAHHRPNSRGQSHQQHAFPAAPLALLPSRTNLAAATSSTTALHAKGFGPPPPTPNPSAYYAPEDDEDEAEGPFPDVFADTSRKVETPKGIGTLLSRGDEVIRELSSEEYLDILRDWAPLASFASSEVLDPEIKESAVKIRTVLRGMAVSFSCRHDEVSVFMLQPQAELSSTREDARRRRERSICGCTTKTSSWCRD